MKKFDLNHIAHVVEHCIVEPYPLPGLVEDIAQQLAAIEL